MALRSLVLAKKIREKKAMLEELRKAAEALETREADLEKDIESAETDEEREAVEAAVNQFDADSTENANNTATLEKEIADLERELAEAEQGQGEGSAAPQNPGAPPARGANHSYENRRYIDMPRISRRELTRETLTRAEVREFYQQLAELVKTRGSSVSSVSNTSLLIPEIVMMRIEDRMGDYATVSKEVETINVGGTSRIIIDGADPEAIWVEMSDAIEEIQASFDKVELDGFKLAGYMAIPNDIIEDSLINLAEYVEKKLAKAIAKSRDKAILIGTGPTNKQPVGIIPSLAAVNKPAAIPFNLGEILSKISLVDDGEESYGEIIAVMKRSTFYAHFVKKLITVDSAGRYVVPNLMNPNIGTRVVMSQYMPANKILFGDFKRYIMAQRSGVSLDQSKDVRFIEDQTVIKGLQRMDGKPVHVDENDKTADWVLVEIDPDGVNKNSLNAAIAQAYGLTAADYTVITWGNLTTALAAAVTASNNAAATQAAVDTATSNLNGAIAALVEEE